MVISTYTINLISFHKRNLNLALLGFMLLLKDFSPTLYCTSFNYSYGVVKKQLHTVLKAPHIHKKAKNSFALFKYKSVVKFDIALKNNYINYPTYLVNLKTLIKKDCFNFKLPIISEYIKFLIKTSKITPYVSTQLSKRLYI